MKVLYMLFEKFVRLNEISLFLSRSTGVHDISNGGFPNMSANARIAHFSSNFQSLFKWTIDVDCIDFEFSV